MPRFCPTVEVLDSRTLLSAVAGGPDAPPAVTPPAEIVEIVAPPGQPTAGDQVGIDGKVSPIRRWMAGRHEPQLVPAESALPTASTLISPWLPIASTMVFMPTSKQTQTTGPRSGCGVAGRPASSSTDEAGSAAASCAREVR